MKKKILLLLSIVLGTFYQSINAQCGTERTIPICDIATLDLNSDMIPDGQFDLYAATGTTPADGTWSTSFPTAIILDSATGIVSTWEIEESSVNNESYDFFLNSPTCGTDPMLTVHLIIGAYSGIAIPPDADGINLYICSTDFIDLSTVLVSNTTTPVAHHNGEWEIAATSPSRDGQLINNVFTATVEYQPGLPRVDQDIYEFNYVVPGHDASCTEDSETTIRIAVVRQVSSGEAMLVRICEDAIINGDYDDTIDVTEDPYLLDEDIEGYWVGDPHPLINIRDEYLDFTNNGADPRFQCESFSFKYTVEKRSVVCSDASSTVVFEITESLRDFEQDPTKQNEFCSAIASDPITEIDLWSLIKFQDQFEYISPALTNWKLISGPSNLGLFTRSDVLGITEPCISDVFPEYTGLGNINLINAPAGDYVFEYSVCPDIIGCSSHCPVKEALIHITINPRPYTGEDTFDVNLCDTEDSVDLFSLMNTVGSTDIDTSGVWTDVNTGAIISNPFTIPTLTVPSVSHTLSYSVVTPKGCTNSSLLSFTIFKDTDAGQNNSVEICGDSLTLNLFDHLEGTPDPTGLWSGPFGYVSPDHLGAFIQGDPDLPVLHRGTYTYKVLGNPGCPDEKIATLDVNIVIPEQIGDDVNATFCKLDGRVNLFSLLDSSTARTGFFEDTPNTNALADDGTLSFETLTNEIYSFKYIVTRALPCDEASLMVHVQIIDIPTPQVGPQQFCILNAARLDDIEVDVLNYNWYDTLDSDTPITENPILLDNQIFYIAQFDANDCESERVAVTIDILNLGEKSIDNEVCTLDFQDGVSPNDDSFYDTFDLEIDGVYNIPDALPDFELNIYNRYGTLVYKGTKDTQEFHGKSNTSVRLGDDLGSGTYFYVFTPNFKDNLPIQGSFYLSR